MAPLSDFVAEVIGSEAIRVEEQLGDGFVRLMVDEAERRQAAHDVRWVEDAVIELLRNARDAGASSIYVATGLSEGVRKVVVLDDGEGIPQSLWTRVFEARVTSKLDTMHTDRWGVHGRGMALFSIRQNALEARVVASGLGLGTAVSVAFDTARLPERKDQSTWPQCRRSDTGALVVDKGPHNLLRTVCEFALEERGQLSVFVGSAAEIVATMLKRSERELDPSALLFADDPASFPVTQRVALATTAAQLVEVAGSLGLSLSERNAHRVLAGAVRPVRSVMARLAHHGEGARPAAPVDLQKDRRGLRLTSADEAAFSRELERVFGLLEERYYVSLAEPPRISVKGDQIRVVFEVNKGQEG